jgi:hypothetical protein
MVFVSLKDFDEIGFSFGAFNSSKMGMRAGPSGMTKPHEREPS